MDAEATIRSVQEDLMLAAHTAERVLRFAETQLKLTPRQAMVTMAISYIAVCDMTGLDDQQTVQLVDSLIKMSSRHHASKH